MSSHDRRGPRAIVTSLVFLTTLACAEARRQRAARDDCRGMLEHFQSVDVPLELLGKGFEERPLAEGVRTLEAGYEAACRVGGTAEILGECADGKAVTTYPILSRAPVVATDPEGFTVVLITEEDARALEPFMHQLFFWARCGG